MEHLKLSRAQKFQEKYISPYEMLATPTNTVYLHLLTQVHIHNIVNIEQVKPYCGPVKGKEVHCPGPIKVTEEGSKEWKAESILDSQFQDSKLQYLAH